MWHKLPVKERVDLLRSYKIGGYSYRDAINNYNDAYKKFAQGGVQPAIDNSLIKSQYNRSETVNQPVNDIYKKRYINTDPDIIGSKYWDYRDPKKDSSVENALEYVPVIGNMLSVNDMMDAQRSFYNNPNRSTATSAALETLGMYPMGKGFGKAKQFMVDAAVQGSSDIAEYTGDKKTKSK